jgi:hypothetical protein
MSGGWRIGNNGHSARRWLVLCGPGNHENEYAEDARGNIRRFASPAAAQRVADALNGGSR